MVIVEGRRIVALLGLAAVTFGMTYRPAAQPLVSSTTQTFTVSGDPSGVRRFVLLQQSRRPALQVRNMAGGAHVYLPPSFTGEQLVGISREALAADLSYAYEQNRSHRVLR